MGGINDAFDSQNIAAQLDYFRRSDEQREALVENIIKQYELLHRNYQERCRDYENEVQSRRLWQSQYETARHEQLNMQRSTDSNPFVLALIDGDGAIFQDELLKAGRDGGADAAHRLLTQIKKYIQANFENASYWSVMMQIYVNLEGLGRKLAAIGMISNPAEIHGFTRAFSLNQPLFSIVDVGSGKERADHKLKELFRLFISNVQCKHILFGGTHDNGYLPNLDPYKRDMFAAKRITLLECTTVQPGFRELGFPIVRFESVFRNTNLPDKLVNESISPIPRLTNLSTITRPSSGGPAAIPTYATPPPLSDLRSTSTWATVGKNGITEKKINIASSSFVPRKFILTNAMDQRLDTPLGRADKAALDRVNERTQKNKCCNEYHLKGKCNSQPCPYEHGERLSSTEQVALRYKIRSRSCQLGDDCRSFDCFWAHQCHNEDSGNSCSYGGQCYLARMHGKDLHAALKEFEDGTIEPIH